MAGGGEGRGAGGGALTCLRRDRGEGLGVGGGMRGRVRLRGDLGWTGETSGTCSSSARRSQGWECTEVTEPAGGRDEMVTHATRRPWQPHPHASLWKEIISMKKGSGKTCIRVQTTSSHFNYNNFTVFLFIKVHHFSFILIEYFIQHSELLLKSSLSSFESLFY